MAFSRKTTVADADVLAQKKNRLNAYVAQFDKAVSLITDTIDNLGVINGNINSTIQEIDEYQQELAATRTGLAEAKERNDKVIANFQALLNV
jgi:septal ring factor EnvC (AmiA/AmiB activator)